MYRVESILVTSRDFRSEKFEILPPRLCVCWRCKDRKLCQCGWSGKSIDDGAHDRQHKPCTNEGAEDAPTHSSLLTVRDYLLNQAFLFDFENGKDSTPVFALLHVG